MAFSWSEGVWGKAVSSVPSTKYMSQNSLSPLDSVREHAACGCQKGPVSLLSLNLIRCRLSHSRLGQTVGETGLREGMVGEGGDEMVVVSSS